jgi:hypothetical protein
MPLNQKSNQNKTKQKSATSATTINKENKNIKKHKNFAPSFKCKKQKKKNNPDEEIERLAPKQLSTLLLSRRSIRNVALNNLTPAANEEHCCLCTLNLLFYCIITSDVHSPRAQQKEEKKGSKKKQQKKICPSLIG